MKMIQKIAAGIARSAAEQALKETQLELAAEPFINLKLLIN